MKKRYGIIAIGYNRATSLKRLLEALNNAEYFDYHITLIISLDYAGMPEIVNMAEQYRWEHGEKIVKAYKERQGLRRHILCCGDYLEEFQLDAAAVFEDDVLPSPAFFNYMVQAVEFYGQCDEIAGISLYTHLWNEVYSRPFQPLYTQYSTFFMQYAQSWGQVWLYRQWTAFKKWYEKHSENFQEAQGVPPSVCEWKDSSWLKYHIRYCVEQKKYFVYPYESLTTNFTEIGTHNKCSTTMYQVPLQTDIKKQYFFAPYRKTEAVYDAFFENECTAKKLKLPFENICVDIYGSKRDMTGKKYWLTTCKADYKIEKTYGLFLRPQELNIWMNIPGTEIRLYNLEQPEKNPDKKGSMYQYFDYYFRLTHVRGKELLVLLWERIWKRVKG